MILAFRGSNIESISIFTDHAWTFDFRALFINLVYSGFRLLVEDYENNFVNYLKSTSQVNKC
jgi:hypothetical protein